MLRDIIASTQTGQVVCLPSGTHKETLVIDRAITLVGSQTVLSGQGDSAIVVVAPVEVVLEGLFFRGGQAWAGGAIFLTAGATLIAERCRFERNTAPPFGGGAIFAEEGAIRLGNCRFKENAAPRGGSIFVDGQVRLDAENCVFEGESGIGGAIYGREATQLTFRRCTFTASDESSPIAAHGSTTRQPSLSFSDCVLGSSEGQIIAGSEGIYRPRVDMARCLLSSAIDDSVISHLADCEIGEVEFKDGNPALGLVDATDLRGYRRDADR